MELLVFLSLSVIASLTDAEPIRGCSGAKGNYFVGDRQNPCVYYWCEDGNFLQWVFPCSRGSAVPYGYFGQIVPCIDNRRTCHGGAPTAAIIRDPAFGDKVHIYTTTPSPYPTQSPQDDDTPTLSHRPKHVPTEGPQGQGGAMGSQGQDTNEHNWEGGAMDKHDKDTMEPNREGGAMDNKKGTDKKVMGRSTTPDSRPTTTPYQATRTASTTPGTTRQVPSTTGGHLFSSVYPETSNSTVGGHGKEGSRGKGGASTPDVQAGDRRNLPSGNVEDSSTEGMRHVIRRSTVVPRSEIDKNHPDMFGKGDTSGRPDKNGFRHTPMKSSNRPDGVGGTMSSTRLPAQSTPGFVRPTDGFVKVVRSTNTTTPPTTSTPPTTTTPPTTPTTTTPTSTPTTTPTTTTTTTRRTTTTTTTTTPRPTRRTTPSTTTPPTTTTTTAPPTPIPDDDGFDFFGFETQGGPTVDIESLPRVIDHGEEEEEENEEGVRPTEKTTTPKVTTRGLPEFLRTSGPAFPKTARTQPPLPTTSPTNTTPVPTTTTTLPTTTTQRPTTTTTATTTTERTTIAPPPTDDPCDEKLPMRGGGQVITKVFPQHHIVGGERRANFTFQIGVIHVTLEIKMASMCYLACDLHPGCAGFDWDIEDGSCWFHTEERECTSTVTYMGGAIAHYRLEDCGGVSDTESLKLGGTSAGGFGRGAPEDEQSPVDQFVSQLTSGSEPVGVVKPLPHDLQADEMAGQQDGAPRDPGRQDDFESGRPRRVFNMIIDHGRSRDVSEEESESEWEHGS